MDYSMRIVQRQCAKYLEMFAQCMHEFPHTWQTDCEAMRAKLARCAENNPEIMYIKTTCRPEFQVYERCMESNQVDPEKCIDFYEKFTTCADKALQAIQGTQDSSIQDDSNSSS